jgi:hypothetical protein
LFYVMVHGFGTNLAVVGPKLDPTFFGNQADGRQARTAYVVWIGTEVKTATQHAQSPVQMLRLWNLPLA